MYNFCSGKLACMKLDWGCGGRTKCPIAKYAMENFNGQPYKLGVGDRTLA